MVNKEEIIKRAKDNWNQKADEYNQWDDLSGDEMVDLVADEFINMIINFTNSKSRFKNT